MDAPVLFTDSIEGLLLGQTLHGAVMVLRDGVLLDVYGFGSQSAEASAQGYPMAEGGAGPALTAQTSAVRATLGVDSGDNGADFVAGPPTPGSF